MDNLPAISAKDLLERIAVSTRIPASQPLSLSGPATHRALMGAYSGKLRRLIVPTADHMTVSVPGWRISGDIDGAAEVTRAEDSEIAVDPHRKIARLTVPIVPDGLSDRFVVDLVEHVVHSHRHTPVAIDLIADTQIEDGVSALGDPVWTAVVGAAP